MDLLFEDSREDKSIEDYLFSGYRPLSKSTFDKDQHFAKPIEDEDLFGCIEGNDICNDKTGLEEANDEAELSLSDELVGSSNALGDLSGYSDSDVLSCNNLFDDPEETLRRRQDNNEDIIETVNPNEEDESNCQKGSQSIEKESEPQVTVDENARPTNSDILESPSRVQQACNITYSKPKALTPVQVKKKLFKERLLEQARALAVKPRRLGTGFGPEDKIEVELEQHRLVSDTNSKFIFNKLFNKSKKALDSSGTPERDRRSWESYKDSLRKRICSQKRKIWDSFQKPTDNYNEEEELIEEARGEDLEETAKNDEDSDANDDTGHCDEVDRVSGDEQHNTDDHDEDCTDAEQGAGSQDEDSDDEAVVRRKNRAGAADEQDEASEQAPSVVLEEMEEVVEPVKKNRKTNVIKNRNRSRLTLEKDDDEDEDDDGDLALNYSDDEEKRPAKKRRKHIESDDEPMDETEEDILFG